jgi:glycosyltransferase involved in cell wall biosynthesis
MSALPVAEVFDRKKVCVLIPTYNNSKTLASVISGVQQYTSNIIVVNDGSTDDTAGILNNFRDLAIVSYSTNQGKGHALQMGFKKAVELGYDYAISIDSDGQHYADDLPAFLEMLEQHPRAIIIGARNMDQASVPGKSSFGNKFSNFWFRLETGIKVSDTQSGYRLYPVSLLHSLRYFTTKYEFEIEVLVRAAWMGIEVVQVPVKVFYAEKEKRVSHFRPFRDFTRISVLNTFLVIITFLWIKPRDFVRSFKKKNFRDVLHDHLFNVEESDSLKATSVGFGVFMGIVPLWGFQLLIAITLSFLFRLNKALVIIAANISIPPMIPFIIFLSHSVGALWMGKKAQHLSFTDNITLDLVYDNFLQYVLGAVTLAIGSGVIFGVLTYGIIKIIRSRKPAHNN